MTQDVEEMLEDIASCHPEAAKEFRRLQKVEEAAKKVLMQQGTCGETLAALYLSVWPYVVNSHE